MGLVQDIGGINLFVLISAVSLLFCAPLALVMESSQWGGALAAAKLTVGTQVTALSAPSDHAAAW